MEEKDNILLETGTNELEIAEFEIFTKKLAVYNPNADPNSKESNQLSDKPESQSDDKISKDSYSERKKGAQSYGINVAKVREILKMPKITKMPNPDKNVIGVFKLRDKIIPLIDLAVWMNQEDDVDYSKCNVIVTEFNQSNFGFVIHGVNGIHRVSWENILSPSKINEHSQSNTASCITGIVNLKDRIMMMLDFEKIVADINPEMSLSIKADKSVIDGFKFDTSSKKTALVAEDSDIVRDLFVEILEKGGFEVINANNGKVAWDYLMAVSENAKSAKKNISDFLQVVITDIEMPQMDGHSLCRKIKEDENLKELPVILFSSLIYEEIKRKGELIGADAQISKPEIGNLLNIISEVINSKK